MDAREWCFLNLALLKTLFTPAFRFFFFLKTDKFWTWLTWKSLLFSSVVLSITRAEAEWLVSLSATQAWSQHTWGIVVQLFFHIFFLHSPPEESVIGDSCVLAGVHVLFSLAVFYFAHIKTVSVKLSNSLWACKQQNIVAAVCCRSKLSISLCLQVHFLAIRPIIVTTWGDFFLLSCCASMLPENHAFKLPIGYFLIHKRKLGLCGRWLSIVCK